MTIEQLEKANEIRDKIKKLECFVKAYKCSSEPNVILAKYVIYLPIGDAAYKESRFELRDFPDLQDFISGYISDKITELEKQLEEL